MPKEVKMKVKNERKAENNALNKVENKAEHNIAYVNLVQELCLQSPDKAKLKQLCEKTGYTFSDNLVELMSDVLILNETSKIQKNHKELVK